MTLEEENARLKREVAELKRQAVEVDTLHLREVQSVDDRLRLALKALDLVYEDGARISDLETDRDIRYLRAQAAGVANESLKVLLRELKKSVK